MMIDFRSLISFVTSHHPFGGEGWEIITSDKLTDPITVI
jgi:hypothetical protein